MKTRPYGKNKENLSVIGFGGIIVMNETQADADRFVAEAIDAGVNYFDVAPSYGNAQDKLGPALSGKRNKVFLACKTEKRTRQDAEEALNHSLRTMQTEYFDLYQFHGMTTQEDVDTVFGPDGAMEAVVKAVQAGKIRHVGFSAHSDEAALACLDRFPFESVLFPLNWMTYLREDFGKPLIKRAEESGLTLLALKAMARCSWPENLPREQRPYPKCWYEPLTEPDKIAMALRFTLSLPVTAAIAPGHMPLFRQAIRLVDADRPLTAAELTAIKAWDIEQKPIFTGKA